MSFARRCTFVSILALMAVPAAAATPEAPRIEQMQRCGDLLDAVNPTFCLQVTGLAGQPLELTLNRTRIPAGTVTRDGDRLRFTLAAAGHESGPLWLQQDGRPSNPVWLTLRPSHVVAATKDEVAKNMDGLTTYVDLVSVIIEEGYEGLKESRRLAEKYGAEVVGMIPPLNTYQLRLPAKDLDDRDAMVLRLGSELSVDSVIVEESGSEESVEADLANAEMASEDEWASNRFVDAVNFYQRRIANKASPLPVHPVRIGVIERNVDFDSPDFATYLGDCRSGTRRTCVFARDAAQPDGHGTTVTGVLAAAWNDSGNRGFLSGLDKASPGFEIIVERNSDAGIAANIAASVNLVEDGVRVLNWSWGIHRVGTIGIDGKEVDSLVRSGLAMTGYEELLEEFFHWLRREHPDVIVVNSAGNAASFSGRDEYRLPSSFVTEQLFVVGGHERSDEDVPVEDPRYAEHRKSSNIDMRVDITAAACVRGSTLEPGTRGEIHCGTSYSTPLVTGLLAAMLSIDPKLHPDELRMLLRRSAMTIGEEYDFEPVEADELTAPILPSERDQDIDHPDVGYSARLNMQKALDLTVQSLDRIP